MRTRIGVSTATLGEEADEWRDAGPLVVAANKGGQAQPMWARSASRSVGEIGLEYRGGPRNLLTGFPGTVEGRDLPTGHAIEEDGQIPCPPGTPWSSFAQIWRRARARDGA